MVAILLFAAGVALLLAAWGLTRAERLTPGHGVVWILIGALLCLEGLLLRRGGGPAAAGSAATLALGLPLAFLLVLALAQTCTLTRLEARVRQLAQEIALLRAERGESSVNGEPASAAGEGAAQAARDAARPGSA